MTALEPTAYWDREATAPVTPPESNWMANPLVRQYINESISGDKGLWPMDWFQRFIAGRKFQRALSIGCGTGPLERDLMRRGMVARIDAFDGSAKSIEIAEREAAAAGFADRIHYFLGDFNAIDLPKEKYDLVCFHQSLHHVTELERLMLQVRRTLRPDGIVYLDEYIGPSRTYWNEERLRWYRSMYQMLPRGIRYFDEFKMPIQEEDPSEAIRSGDIVSRLAIGFDIEVIRGYGGNLLGMLFPQLSLAHVTDADVEKLIVAEKALLGCGVPPFHAVIVARPKKRHAIATLRYQVEGHWPDATRRAREVVRFLRT